MITHSSLTDKTVVVTMNLEDITHLFKVQILLKYSQTLDLILNRNRIMFATISTH